MKKIIFLIFGLIILVIVYHLISQIWQTTKSGERFSRAVNKLYSLEVKNKELKQKLSEVKTPQFIEEQARNKLGLSKPGETVVVIPPEKISEVLGLSGKIEEIRLPNWLGWLKVFFK